MAIRGRKPTAIVIRLATGNPGGRPMPQGEPAPTGKPRKPPKLKGRAAELWDEVTAFADWLTEADGYKLHVWCELQAQFERGPAKMVSARIGQLRSSGSELGLDPASRARLGKGADGTPKAQPTNTSPPDDPATAWAKAVTAGKIVAGPHIRTPRGAPWYAPPSGRSLGPLCSRLRMRRLPARRGVTESTVIETRLDPGFHSIARRPL